MTLSPFDGRTKAMRMRTVLDKTYGEMTEAEVNRLHNVLGANKLEMDRINKDLGALHMSAKHAGYKLQMETFVCPDCGWVDTVWVLKEPYEKQPKLL